MKENKVSKMKDQKNTTQWVGQTRGLNVGENETIDLFSLVSV